MDKLLIVKQINSHSLKIVSIKSQLYRLGNISPISQKCEDKY